MEAPTKTAVFLEHLGRRRLAEVVGQDGQREQRAMTGSFPIVESHERVEAVLSVVEDVAFGVPLGIL